ncbi:MauE/DoxX family redox-associated membrane protein [Parafilimonas terrae]|uniref:Methylamine utilisation protein MauE n=1 Tax=Parafilimonas terrae TaxID=1465490 RepID=A0A1I5XGJ4_9BACT|nr:MauE/DoxX family redox-associated membrane protein [Parafilimonas terrae]SFQ31054.1 Methylamine utilisation protein MauE [Parafilimonas terrae]
MKKPAILKAIQSLLILLFTYAAVSKLFDFNTFREQLSAVLWLSKISGLLSLAIPLTELLIVVFLAVPKAMKCGLYSAAIMLASFTLFLIIMISFNAALPCSCGGVISSLSWRQHIVFNFFFLALAIAGIFLEKKNEVRHSFKFN